MRRRGIVLVLIGLVLLAGIAPVSAHANLLRSDPPQNAALMRPPEVIALWFTEPLEPAYSGITLLDGTGQQIETPPVEFDPADPTHMMLRPGDLPDGLYTVRWRALSSADGHATEGSLAFTIGVVAGGSAGEAAIFEVIPADGALIRWLDVLSMSLAVGSVAFWLFVWTPSGLGPRPEAERRMQTLMWVGWTLLGVTGVLALMLQVSLAANVPLIRSLAYNGLFDFLQDTRYGHLWLARMALWLLFGLVLALSEGRRRLLWAALVVGGAVLLTRSLFSHASVAPDVHAAVAGDWLHLLMTALWLGGLAQFANVLLALRRAGEESAAFCSLLVMQFSNYARVAVAGLIVTGLYAAWLQVGSVDALLTTLYGRALLVKLILFAPLLGVAALNLIVTSRGLRANQVVWVPRLRGLIGVELTLLVGILLAVGVMTSMNPARSVAAMRQASARSADTAFFQMQLVDDLHVHLDIVPGIVGENTYTVELFDEDGNPVTDATLVRLRFESLERNTGLTGVRLEPQPDGTYRATGLHLSLPGVWRARATIQRPGKYDSVVDFEPTIALAAPVPAASSEAPLADRTLALLITGMVALGMGGFFAGRARAPLWRGMGLLVSSIVVVGLVFLLSGVMTL